MQQVYIVRSETKHTFRGGILGIFESKVDADHYVAQETMECSVRPFSVQPPSGVLPDRAWK